MEKYCKDYIKKNLTNKYLVSINTNQGNKFLGNFETKKEACDKLIEFLKLNKEIKLHKKYCYY